MTSDRRARADNEGKGSAALSTWLTDTLRPPRPEPVAAAVEPAPEGPPAEAVEPAERSSKVEAWDDGGEHTPALGTALDSIEQREASKALAARPLPAIDFPRAAAVAEVATEEPSDGELRAEGAETESDEGDAPEDRAMLAAPVLPAIEDEVPPDFDEPDPHALFLAQERTARRNQRVAVAVLVAFLLLIGGSYLLMRGGGSEPEARAAEAPVGAPAQPPVAAKPGEPAPPENDEVELLEEEAVPGVKSGFSAALRAPGSASAEPFAPGGPSTARYPDLPRDVLIQLENAASTEQQR